MRAHLRHVDWLSIVGDAITAPAAIAVGFWIWDTDQFSQILTAGFLGYAFWLITAAVWDIARPVDKQHAQQVDEYQDTIDGLLDTNDRLLKLNDRLDNENAELAAENDRLQQKADEWESTSADQTHDNEQLTARVMELEAQLSEYTAA